MAVPADVAGVLSVALPVSLADMSDGFGFLPIDPALAKEMQGALLEHSKAHIGIDASQVRSAVVFVKSEPAMSGAAIFSPIEGSMKGTAVTEDGVRYVNLVEENGAEIVAAQLDKTLIVGEKSSVMAAIATMKGEQDSLTKVESPFGKFVSSQVSKSYFSVTADLSKLPLPEIPMTEGLSHAGLRFAGNGIHLSVHGKNETLEMLSATAKGGLVMATNMAQQNMEASSDDFAEGAAGIMGYYMAKNFTSMLEPTIEGDELSLDFPFQSGGSTPMIFVAVTGVLAAVAIPAFMKYIKKSKAAEARMFLHKLFEGARMLSMEGKPLPASVGPTPPLGSCCQQGEKCQPDPALWQHPSWQALQFAVMDPHYYSYEFVNQADSYAFKAYGDLDCDGMYSTFVMHSSSADLQEGQPDLLKQDPLE